MLKVETLDGETPSSFPDPEGEVIELINHNKRSNKLTVLTQIEEPENICGVEKADGEICQQSPPEECPWHDEEDRQ